MNNELQENFDFKVVTTQEERKKLAHLTSYAFIPAPADLTRPQLGFESIKDSFIQGVYLKTDSFPISTATCTPMTQNIRGKILKMGGVEAVATQPEFRRLGLVKKLMQNILNHAKESGEVVSTLYPFKESFYGKFGYISLPQVRIATIQIRNINQIVDVDVTGKVEHFYLNEVFDRYYQFTVEIQLLIHGMSLKSKDETNFVNATNPKFVAFAYEEEEITGVMVYNTEGMPKNMDVRFFYYKNSNAKYLLLGFIAKHVDQFSEVSIPLLPSDYPHFWLTDLHSRISIRSFASLAMGRVIDVQALEGISVGTGSITVSIIDNQCSWNEGIFRFISDEGKLIVEKIVDRNIIVDCSLTISGLSALVYGGYNIADFQFRKWINNTRNWSIILKKLSDLFPSILAHMHEDF